MSTTPVNPTPDQSQPVDQQNPQVGQTIAMSNADDSRNGVSVANQAPAYGDPGQPKAPPAPAPSQAQLHTGWFHSMLARMNQGDAAPVRDRSGNPVVDPQTGQVKLQPLSSKQMGRSILAGVLSAMAATESHQSYRNGNGIWENPQNEAVQAGEQAFQGKLAKNQIAQAQQQANNQRTQQYAVYDANMKMLAQTQQLYQLKGAQMKDAVDHYKDLSDQFQQGGIVNPETGESLYDPNLANMTPQEAEDHLKKGDITKDLMFPVSVEPIIGRDGEPTGQSQLRWAAIKGPANIHVNQAMIDKYPELKGVPVDTSIPITQYLKLARTSADNSSLGSMIQNVADAQIAANMPGAKPVNFNWDQFRRDARLTPDQMHQMHGLAGMPPDDFITKIRQMDSANGGGGRIAEALAKQGITVDDKEWAKYRGEEKKGVGAEQAAPERVAALPDLAKGVGLTPEQTQLALSELPKTGATNDEVTKATENIRSQAKTNSEQANKLSAQQSVALDKSYQFNSTQLEKVGKPVDDAVARFGRLQDTINQSTPQADALVAPELLTVMAGGAGSGLRMNEAEISRIVGGRSNFESLKAAANKWQADPTKALSITASQRQQIKALMTVVYSKLQEKQSILDDARQGLISGMSQAAHRQVVADAKKKLDGIDAQTNFGGQVIVKLPNGQTASFPNQAAADHFKKLSGVQ